MARIKNTRQIMEVMQAYLDGKKIERRHTLDVGNETMWRVSKTPDWNWNHYDYRVKQEPREFVVVVAPNGTPLGVANINGVIPVHQRELASAKVIKVREVLEDE